MRGETDCASPDDVGHFVLVLPHQHPEVARVADGGQTEVELLLRELLREEEAGGDLVGGNRG